MTNEQGRPRDARIDAAALDAAAALLLEVGYADLTLAKREFAVARLPEAPEAP